MVMSFLIFAITILDTSHGRPLSRTQSHETESVQATWLIRNKSSYLIFLELSITRRIYTDSNEVLIDFRRSRCAEGSTGSTLKCKSLPKDIMAAELINLYVDPELTHAEAAFQVGEVTNHVAWRHDSSQPPNIFSYEGACPDGSEQGVALRQRASGSGHVLHLAINENSSNWNRFWIQRGRIVSQCPRQRAEYPVAASSRSKPPKISKRDLKNQSSALSGSQTTR